MWKHLLHISTKYNRVSLTYALQSSGGVFLPRISHWSVFGVLGTWSTCICPTPRLLFTGGVDISFSNHKARIPAQLLLNMCDSRYDFSLTFLLLVIPWQVEHHVDQQPESKELRISSLYREGIKYIMHFILGCDLSLCLVRYLLWLFAFSVYLSCTCQLGHVFSLSHPSLIAYWEVF